jgi:hypothetical protein
VVVTCMPIRNLFFLSKKKIIIIIITIIAIILFLHFLLYVLCLKHVGRIFFFFLKKALLLFTSLVVDTSLNNVVITCHSLYSDVFNFLCAHSDGEQVCFPLDFSRSAFVVFVHSLSRSLSIPRVASINVNQQSISTVTSLITQHIHT